MRVTQKFAFLSFFALLPIAINKFIFNCVGLAASFWSSLVRCHSAIAARSRHKNLRHLLVKFMNLFLAIGIIGLFCFSSGPLHAQTTPTPASPRNVLTPVNPASQPQVGQPTSDADVQFPFDAIKRPSLVTQAVSLTILSLMPFIIMILTSFLKIVIVLSLLRSALGVQQAPPNQIINGVAFMLSLFIMYPTGLQMYDAAQKVIQRTQAPESITSTDSPAYIIAVASEAREPLRGFLKRNSSINHQALFYRIAYRILPDDHRADLKPDDFMVIVPAYITSQLKDAFEIGVLIYIPFFVIDLVTSNILLAMGMMMLSPPTISLPLKLFLLVMLDGWTLLVEGLVNTFR